MVESIQTITLGKQLIAAGGMMLVMTVVHALGLTGILLALNLKNEHLKEMHLGFKSISTLSAMGLLLLGLHTIEIAIFAGFYLMIEAVPTLEDALYYSASTYATLGPAEEYFPSDWRLMGAVEALIGFLLIGWSTAFIANKVDRLMPD